MVLAVKHNFVTTKSDGTDATLLRPSNWNEDHDITLATATLIGRQSAGAGPAEEIPCSAAAAAMLAAADIPGILAALGISPATTGDVQLTFKTTAAPGWVMCNEGTIGDALSGASSLASDACVPLFTLLYNNVNDANAPVFTSSGVLGTRAGFGTATQALAAHCRLKLTKTLGRAIAIAGSNGGPAGAWALGQSFGEEVHTLSANEMPQHRHSVFISDPGHTHSSNACINLAGIGVTGGGAFAVVGGGAATINSATTGISIVSGDSVANATLQAGGSASHNNIQPTTFLNAMVKL